MVCLALPVLMPMIGKAKALEAQLQLKHVLQLEQSYFFMKSKYSNSAEEIGYEQAKLVTEDGRANYKIEIIESSSKNFKARATAITDFDQDGTLNVWEVDKDGDIKEITKD